MWRIRKSIFDALHARVPEVDILINNAAVALDEGISVLDVERDLVQTTMQTNFRGPLLLCQAYVPGMQQRRWGTNRQRLLGRRAARDDDGLRAVVLDLEGRAQRVDAAGRGGGENAACW